MKNNFLNSCFTESKNVINQLIMHHKNTPVWPQIISLKTRSPNSFFSCMLEGSRSELWTLSLQHVGCNTSFAKVRGKELCWLFLYTVHCIYSYTEPICLPWLFGIIYCLSLGTFVMPACFNFSNRVAIRNPDFFYCNKMLLINPITSTLIFVVQFLTV